MLTLSNNAKQRKLFLVVWPLAVAVISFVVLAQNSLFSASMSLLVGSVIAFFCSITIFSARKVHLLSISIVSGGLEIVNEKTPENRTISLSECPQIRLEKKLDISKELYGCNFLVLLHGAPIFETDEFNLAQAKKFVEQCRQLGIDVGIA